MRTQRPEAAAWVDGLCAEVQQTLAERIRGRVAGVRGLLVSAHGLPAPVGARCLIHARRGGAVEAELVGMQNGQALLTVLGESAGIAADDWVEVCSGSPRVAVGFDLLGRVLDAQGRSIDGGAAPRTTLRYPLYCDPPAALQRRAIDAPLSLGIRSIDGLLTAGRGQRLGIFAGTGVGKSVLMGMMCRHTQAQVNVVALVGERGREVGDFLRKELGPEGLARSVVVVSSSDEAPAARVRAGFTATAIAEFFRDEGLDVLLLMDSLTRMAMAQRQIGLAAGEPPATKGYPPSTFALLPRLLERAGRTTRGSITGLYTVLVEGDDLDDPISDAARGILDGHIVLSRRLANRGQFPAVDVLESISRLAYDVMDPQMRTAVQSVRRTLATWAEIEDLVSIGAYVPGVDRDYDVAVQMRSALETFLRQDMNEVCRFEDTQAALRQLHEAIERLRSTERRA